MYKLQSFAIITLLQWTAIRRCSFSCGSDLKSVRKLLEANGEAWARNAFVYTVNEAPV
jgi:hypothetical protein